MMSEKQKLARCRLQIHSKCVNGRRSVPVRTPNFDNVDSKGRISTESKETAQSRRTLGR